MSYFNLPRMGGCSSSQFVSDSCQLKHGHMVCWVHSFSTMQEKNDSQKQAQN
jgi:hypothetical protein